MAGDGLRAVILKNSTTKTWAYTVPPGTMANARHYQLLRDTRRCRMALTDRQNPHSRGRQWGFVNVNARPDVGHSHANRHAQNDTAVKLCTSIRHTLGPHFPDAPCVSMQRESLSPTPAQAARQGLQTAVLGQDSACHWNLRFGGGALPSCSKCSAVEPGKGQTGNVGYNHLLPR